MEQAGEHKQHEDLKRAYRTAYLIAGHINHNLTEEEREELENWILASRENMELFAELTDKKNIAASLANYEKIKVEQRLKQTKEKLSFNKPKQSKRIWTYAIAASLIIIIGLFIFKNFNPSKENPEIAIIPATDITPGTDYASLDLGNGKVIKLAAGSDTLINGHVEALRNKGEIIYGADDTAEAFHTLTIPRKGQYKLTLPDGTKVWLNAESSIRFPTAFTSTERKVFVTGETFFEVAKNKTKPFRVVAGDITVEAVGTAFNINAYPDEPVFTATLSEGAVKVYSAGKQALLQPGQQLQSRGGDFVVATTEAAVISAWRDNEFRFKNTPLDVIMRKVERWYDADVVYTDKVELHLNATIIRDVPVSKLLHLLEATEQVHFKIEGRKIIVSK